MAKRFFDNKKYEIPWFRNLSPQMKCVYDYCICECDHAGILRLDIEAIEFKTSVKPLTLEIIAETFKDKFIFLSEDKIFIPKFIYWQYKNELTPANSVHRSVYQILKREGIPVTNFLAQYVLEEDFEEWGTLWKTLKDGGRSYNDYIKER